MVRDRPWPSRILNPKAGTLPKQPLPNPDWAPAHRKGRKQVARRPAQWRRAYAPSAPQGYMRVRQFKLHRAGRKRNAYSMIWSHTVPSALPGATRPYVTRILCSPGAHCLPPVARRRCAREGAHRLAKNARDTPAGTCVYAGRNHAEIRNREISHADRV